MASPSPDLSDNQPSRKSWTLKDVILCHYRWQPWCTNKPTIIGFESWLNLFDSDRRHCCGAFHHELLTQLRNCGIDLDSVSHFRARQDGKLLDKTANTKYAAQQIAEQIQGWLPARAADPDSRHEITQLRNQLAELKQRAGEEASDNATPPRPGQSNSSPAATPIQRAFMNQSNTPAPPPFDPAYSPYPLQQTNGWWIACPAHWLSEPLENGSKSFRFPKRNVLSSPPTSPKLRHGGHDNLLKLLRRSSESQSWWASRLASWAKTMTSSIFF